MPPVGAAGNTEPAYGLGLEPLPELDLAAQFLRATADDTLPRDRDLTATPAPGTGRRCLGPPLQARSGRDLARPATALGTRGRVRIARDQPFETVTAVAAVHEDRHCSTSGAGRSPRASDDVNHTVVDKRPVIKDENDSLGVRFQPADPA
jgi:hypothetical protein